MNNEFFLLNCIFRIYFNQPKKKDRAKIIRFFVCCKFVIVYLHETLSEKT